MTTEEFKELFTVLGLDLTFDGLKYGGLLSQVDLTIRIPDTAENQAVMLDLLGSSWEDYTETKEYNDKGINYDDVDIAEYTVNNGTEEAPIYAYRFIKIHLDKLSVLAGEKISVIIEKGLSFITAMDKPCPNDTIVTIVLVVIAAIVTIKTGGLTGKAMWAVILSTALTVGLTVGAIEKNDTTTALQAGLALYGGYAAFTTSTGAGIAVSMNFGIAIAAVTLDLMQYKQQQDYMKEMEQLEKESNELDVELQAVEFERKLRFYYGDSYDSPYREGYESDPYEAINRHYNKFSSYSMV